MCCRGILTMRSGCEQPCALAGAPLLHECLDAWAAHGAVAGLAHVPVWESAQVAL